MTWSIYRCEEGQALVQVALALLVLLLFVALAVDVGNIYGERRRMQNAADAGALAGARVLCTLGFDAQGAAVAAAEDYATRNGAQLVTVTFPEINVVDVAVQEAADTFFIGLIGIHTVDVPAEAAALCGIADVTCGMWPIALPERVWIKAPLEHCDGEPILVLIDSEKICGDEVGQLACRDNEVSTGGMRAWLDFAQPDPEKYEDLQCVGNCGAQALKCWIANPYPDNIPIPCCIRGQPGVIGSAFKEAGDPVHHGEIRKIPLFDSFTDDGVCPDGDGDGQADKVLGDSCNTNRMYHITEVVCVRIGHYDSKYEVPLVQPSPEPPEPGEPPPEPTPTPKPEVVKALIVHVVCPHKCTEGCATTPGGIPQPGDVTAVSLIK